MLPSASNSNENERGARTAHTAQHTFIETDSVRYVYRKIEELYLVLITTKSSNILEDKETLKTFTGVISEYCEKLTQTEVMENSFEIIFAFDEIVALGYREQVNLAQIRMFTSMESNDEKEALKLREEQEAIAKIKMLEESKRLAEERKAKGGLGSSNPLSMASSMSSMFSRGSGGGKNNLNLGDTPVAVIETPKKSADQVTRKPGKNKALKLKTKDNQTDQFMKNWGISEAPKSGILKKSGAAAAATSSPAQNQVTYPVYINLEEKFTCHLDQDGSLRKLTVNGCIQLRVEDEKFGYTRSA